MCENTLSALSIIYCVSVWCGERFKVCCHDVRWCVVCECGVTSIVGVGVGVSVGVVCGVVWRVWLLAMVWCGAVLCGVDGVNFVLWCMCCGVS